MKDMQINTQGRLMDYGARLDYALMNEYIDAVTERYAIASVTSIGQTVLGRRIPMISIGKGKKSVLYVGAQAGTDWQTAAVLLRYVNELCEYVTSDGRIYNCSASYLYVTKTVHIIPMLNPDGVEYCRYGISEENPLYSRLKDVGASETWQGNACGGLLRTGYPESFEAGAANGCEPENGALCSYLMFNRDVRLVIALNKGDNSVECTYDGATPPRLNAIGRSLAKLSASEYSRNGTVGSLSRFCAKELVIPCFDMNSGFEDTSDVFCDYYRMRGALFLAPTLI